MSKRTRMFVLPSLIFMSLFAFLLFGHVRQTIHDRVLCSHGTHLLHLSDPIVVTVLRTQEEHRRGLSGKEELPPDEGVIFDFGVVGPQHFWMKDMRFSLDMIFLDSDWRVVKIFSAVHPDSYPDSFDSPDDTRYALEVTSGLVAREQLTVGTALRMLSCEEIY
ncbi:MAG: hypothetical protein A2845_01185 [Candidatus Lloydbacteria bacterium RIFCSPHIGHO2_01_FULL_49_22]|uniref:DUF192 domain-containing protein n=1 Tax=Candidatus Lloydbacteria bacterium RIFCSPHIGHO2_01_FULL_49_22 TaxID=1798658 RepID=A0A1G2CWL7_9BACT|nr:MAG: hypothetical protein A2845_01185 [Candidatus Lloydbacteria bacterium RIFCSPHIGHO2_01_FULL_49_22]OGZ09236.1 MAG: hypothetical protein A3C14_06190 [Candidatus Lloydbacteria bacterium RIFCSPHIGHO2_02_FULL_50_18]